MIEYIKVTNHLGETLNLLLKSPEQSGFFVRNVDGLGPSKVDINVSDALNLDGSFYNSSRVTSKTLILDLGFYYANGESMEVARYQSYRYFPLKKPITIEVKTETRTGIITARVETNEPNIFSQEESAIITLLCPSAYFVAKDSVITAYSGSTGGFEFPFENASLVTSLLEFGDVYINTEANVFYDGDVDTGFVMTADMLGSVNNLTITDVITGQTMALNSSVITALTGSNLVLGDRIEISTKKGNKYVRLIRGVNTYNILNALGTNITWFTLHRGDNVYSISATSGIANVLFTISHQIIYEGL